MEAKSKFEKGQKIFKAEIASKQKKEKEQQQKAAKNQMMVAESSVMLCSKELVSTHKYETQIDAKLNDFKNDLLRELDAVESKTDEKLQKNQHNSNIVMRRLILLILLLIVV